MENGKWKMKKKERKKKEKKKEPYFQWKTVLDGGQLLCQYFFS